MITSAVRSLMLRGFSPVYYCRKYWHVLCNWRAYSLKRARFIVLQHGSTATDLAVTDALKHKGWSPLEFDSTKIDRVVARCQEIDALVKPAQGIAAHGKNFWTVILKSDQARQYPELFDFARNPYFQNIATRYIGEEAVLSDVMLAHSFPTGRDANHSQLWHLDADDTKVLIFYVYCTDVDEESGPFVLAVRDGVRKRLLPRFLRKHGYSDHALHEIYKPREIKVVTGVAGMLFVCDTGNTLHYGSRCHSKHRLAFTFRYTSFSGLYRVNEVA